MKPEANAVAAGKRSNVVNASLRQAGGVQLAVSARQEQRISIEIAVGWKWIFVDWVSE